MKETLFEAFCVQWKPLINKHLSSNKIRGLEKEDLLQEILIVTWNCFTKDCDIRHFSSYLSNSIRNRITELYKESQEFYFPSSNFRCISCNRIVSWKPEKCDCGGTRWRIPKGSPIEQTTDEIPYVENFEQQERVYPKELDHIIENILTGKKTGSKQKQKLREYLRYEWIY